MPILPSIPAASTIEDLRRNVEQTLRTLVRQFSATKINTALDINHNRVTNVANPASNGDAVNLGYLLHALETLRPTRGGTTVDSNTTINITGGASYVAEYTLTADTNIAPVTPTNNPGDRLTVRIAQDSTGGWQITWGGDFSDLTTINITTVPNKRNVFDFSVGNDNLWYPTATPLIEA